MLRRIKLSRDWNRTDYSVARYRVTLFSPKGMYPRGAICTPGALFYADDEIVFAVTHGTGWRASERGLPYSEADWLEPELVRLLGAIMMTEQIPDGLRNRFYPLPHSTFVLNEASVDLCARQVAGAVKAALLRTVDNRLPD